MGKLSAKDDTTALFAQAVMLHQADRLGEAKILYEKILAIDDKHVNACTNLGTILSRSGRHEEGIRLIERSLEINPDQPVALNNLGAALQNLNRLDQALASYDRALVLRPDYAEAHVNRGNALKDLDHLDEALASYERALVLRPDYAEAHVNRGNTFQLLNRLNEALASYDRALVLRPDYAEAHVNRGVALQEQNRFDEALASYDRALVLRPDYAEAHVNRGVALQEQNRFDEALASYDRALALRPDHPYLAGSWLYCKMACCHWEGLDAAFKKIINAIDLRQKIAMPFTILAMPSTPAQQKLCAQNYIQSRFPGSPVPLCQGERHVHDRVRIGYFSSDFGDHPVSHLITRFIECHDRARFEVIGFSFGQPTNDTWRQRLEKAFDRFFEVRTRTDREIAELAHGLEIDIAVDLNGFTKSARTGIFALRPAPVQVNYLGYPGTLGADYMDYLVADRTVLPREHHPYYNEKIVYLPHSFQVNDSSKLISEKSFSRAELGLPEGAFVFCGYNNSYKITPDLFDIWMRLLQIVDGSVLWLSGGNSTTVRNLRREAETRGVSPDRIIFAPRMNGLANHLARHRQADLFLDTFYYNAHTTASDALWAGLPVLTCLGDTFAGRVAASLLHAIGLPELIARSPAEYETLAVALATNPEKLAAIRRKLALNRTTHPLFDTVRFTRHLETAYRRMYERYRAGLPPDDIVVEP